MDWILNVFRSYPELSVFLTIAAGFTLGRLKYKTFSLGTVTSVLLVGVLVGQMRIDISPTVKQVFFLIFLFSVGYSVGPQFFNSLRKSGLPQLLFTVLMCGISLVATWLLARLMGYNAGQAAGLFAGSQTISAVIGVGADTINSLADNNKQALINAIPVCYAVTYLFGTIGSAVLLAQIGPMFWGGLKKVRQTCVEMETKMGVKSLDDTGMMSSFSTIIFRAYNIATDSFVVGKSVSYLEKFFHDDGYNIYVERIRKKGGGEIITPDPDYIFEIHDDLVLQGRGEYVITETKNIGKEIYDKQLLDFPMENLNVLLTNKHSHNITLSELGKLNRGYKVSIKKISRGGIDIPILPGTVIHTGDMLSLIGPKEDVKKVAKLLGYPDVNSEKTDLAAVGLGILIGGLVGVLAFHIGKATISLSTSGGVLIAGLVFGWLRSKHPSFSKIPEQSLWVMNNLGLNAFIAVVGISAGPGFVDGFKEVGPMLFVIGALATGIPLLAGMIMARYIFKFDPALGLGCCCGARTTTAGLPAVQDALNSRLPALGYTVTYAVGNTLLIICGIIIVFLTN